MSFGTWKHHVSIIKNWKHSPPALYFSEITHEFLLSFFAYLRKIGNMDSTAWRNMATIKIYVGAAIRGGYMDQDPFAAIKIRRPKSEVIPDGRRTPPSDRLVPVRPPGRMYPERTPFFLFLCFTSLHIGDAKALQINQFIGNELHYTRGKTKIPVTVPYIGPGTLYL
ncbi:site-specific integrase [Bacteroides thetaiotaomicron]|nr:site-specific integrase [Bacteroides thetaiotaomicron]